MRSSALIFYKSLQFSTQFGVITFDVEFKVQTFVNDRVRRCSEGRSERDSLAGRVFHLNPIPSLKKATVTAFGLLECRCQTALDSWTTSIGFIRPQNFCTIFILERGIDRRRLRRRPPLPDLRQPDHRLLLTNVMASFSFGTFETEGKRWEERYNLSQGQDRS
jgi:hypothetical protein